MSMESAKLFIARMKSDEDFSRQVRDCKDAETRMAFVRQEGFDFTAAEIRQAGEELSDSELDEVAGGTFGDDVCREKNCTEEGIYWKVFN